MADKHVAFEDDDEVTSTAGTTTKAPVGVDEVEFGDEDTMASTGLQKIIPEKNKVARVNLLTDLLGPKKAWVHFIPDKGSYICLSTRDAKGNLVGKPAICCAKTANDDKAKAQLIVGALALQYTNANPKDGKYDKENPKPIEYDIGWLKLSKSGFAKVSRLPDEDVKHHEIDFVISWRSNGIGFEYSRATNKARFRQNPELLAEVKLAAEPYLDGKALSARLGRKVSEADMAALFAGKAAANSSSASIDDVDDI